MYLLSFDMYLLSAYLSGWHGHFWRQNNPFSNLKTVSTVLDSYGHTQNMGSVTFSYCHSCICGNWILLPGDSQLFCSWFYLLISDDSLFICNWGAHLVQKEQSPSNWHIFDTKMDIYLPPGNCQAQSQKPTVEDESAFSSGWGPSFPVSLPPAGTPTSHLAPPDESHARLELQGALWSTILPKYSHLWCFSADE